MIITRKVARWALLLKREALGRTYGAQKRSEQAPRGATAMLPHSGRMVDDNIDTDTDTDTVATDLHRTSSCVALALPLPFPYYYEYYYYPRATRIAASLLNSDRPTLTGHHEDDDYLLSLLARIDEPQVEPKCFDLAASSTKIQPKEQQDEREVHGEQETENVASLTNDKEVTVLANVNSNRLDRQYVRVRFFSA
ncbi:uncharacterized protein LOC122530436 [Frieseomelitta varia]|uniref:uncharacterized protein LOC122530436 n=1 Tax=Frieseomelitta varia TaxID=561572 RepID=UPI001CB68529|nr:uncharacterized protein LOC122530436 [Frieseomelitta varia]XP_043513322.1 uncharacterized protein LOC122530436 [Frieseomelitta varia]XP_043513323.1 uncharacterized protein LOC122530436 [Frieseomelitta varia]